MTYDEARSLEREIETLLDHPGWKRIKNSVEEQVRLRRQEDFSTSITGFDTVIRLAVGRGEIAGLRLAITLPQIILDDVKADIKAILEEEREKGENLE
jgi:hypothetical protein